MMNAPYPKSQETLEHSNIVAHEPSSVRPVAVPGGGPERHGHHTTPVGIGNDGTPHFLPCPAHKQSRQSEPAALPNPEVFDHQRQTVW